METYTLGLALEDFLPVVLSSLGLYIVARMVDHFSRSADQIRERVATVVGADPTVCRSP